MQGVEGMKTARVCVGGEKEYGEILLYTMGVNCAFAM